MSQDNDGEQKEHAVVVAPEHVQIHRSLDLRQVQTDHLSSFPGEVSQLLVLVFFMEVESTLLGEGQQLLR